MNKSINIKAWLFGALSLATLVFILNNSSMDGESSAQLSVKVAEFLKPFLDPNDRIAFDVFHQYVRKGAHFCEFALLGFSLSGFLSSFPLKTCKTRLFPVVIAAACAGLDEFSQNFSSGRGPSVKDVGIDTLGSIFGVLCYSLLIVILQKIFRKAKI